MSTVLRAMRQCQLHHDTAKILKDVPTHCFASERSLPYKEGRSLLPNTRFYFLRPMNMLARIIITFALLIGNDFPSSRYDPTYRIFVFFFS